jgi:hypothetical protein
MSRVTVPQAVHQNRSLTRSSHICEGALGSGCDALLGQSLALSGKDGAFVEIALMLPTALDLAAPRPNGVNQVGHFHLPAHAKTLPVRLLQV